MTDLLRRTSLPETSVGDFPISLSRRAALGIPGFLALWLALLLLPPSTLAQQTVARGSRAIALRERVKCMCGGCNDAVGSCYHSGGTFSGPCDTALGMLKEVDAHLARGESDPAILKSFVQVYGPTVLIEPPKSGFNLTAWIMPIVVPLFGLSALYGVLRRWKRQPRGTPAIPIRVPPDMLARVQREAGRDDL
jgi:cytochrome c-type biogenesis protein CcmH/NrfF